MALRPDGSSRPREAGQQEDQSLAEAWRDELSRVEQEISEFEERKWATAAAAPDGRLGERT